MAEGQFTVVKNLALQIPTNKKTDACEEQAGKADQEALTEQEGEKAQVPGGCNSTHPITY